MTRRTVGKGTSRGSPRRSASRLERTARAYDELGWQLVPQRWTGQARSPNVPVLGTTGGRTPWLDADGVLVAVRDDDHVRGRADLVAEPGERGPAALIPGVRMPHGVVAIDVDHYRGSNGEDKTGADTISEIEQQCGPLPATWTITARGPDSPARRHLFRIPDDVVLTDRWFTSYGGDVDVLRLTHRYSHAPGANHLRTGTPIVCYAPDGSELLTGDRSSAPNRSGLPPVDSLPFLPDAWCKAVREFYADQARTDGTGLRVDGPPELLTDEHATHIVLQARDRLAALNPVGGEFRNAVYGLARVCALHARTFDGATPDDATRYALDQFDLAHPGLMPDGDDDQWIAEGVARAWTLPGWEIDEPEPEPDELEHDEPERADRDEPAELGQYERLLASEVRKERLRQDARAVLEAERRPDRPAFASLVTFDADLETVPLPRMAIRDVLPANAVGWLGGPSGTYKSFVAVDLASAHAYGGDALNHGRFQVRESKKVLYLAGEDFSGVALRFRAARHRRGISESGRVVVYERALDLTDPVQVGEMTSWSVEHGIGHIFVDTFRQSTLGVNENDNTDVGVILGRMLALRDEHGISTTLIDHTNKSAAGLADLGGAGAKRANADYVLMIDLPNGDRSAGQQRTLRMAKLKSGPDGSSWPIKLEPVPDVTDDDGQESAVAVVGVVEGGGRSIHGDDDWRDIAIPHDVRAWTGKGREALSEVCQHVIHLGSGESGASRTEIVRAYRAEHPDTGRTTAEQRVARAWDALHDLGRLEPVTGGSSRTNHHRWHDLEEPPE